MSEQRRVITSSPENSETPLEAVQSWVTPTRLFFIRNHFPVPRIDRDAWRLRIEGAIREPFEIDWHELDAMPQRTLLATLECAGNGRSFLAQRAEGVPWGAGAVAHAEWTGVPLHLVLERAGIEPDAVEIVFTGADVGTEPDHPEPMHFARSLPLAKALDRDTLLALRMNGELLEPHHGFPVRLFVPGWYGVASVKWLERIEAVRTPFRGYFQSHKYTVLRRTEAGTEKVGIQGMAVKSEVLRPRPGERLGAGTQRIVGLAWAGEEAIAQVEVSTDGGRAWAEAELLGPHARYSWVLWEYLWEVAEPGDYSIVARATTATGRQQPAEHEPLLGGYMIHHCRPRAVYVERAPDRVAANRSAESLLYDMNAFAEENASRPLDVDLEFTLGAGI